MDKKNVLVAFFLFVALAGVISANLKGELGKNEAFSANLKGELGENKVISESVNLKGELGENEIISANLKGLAELGKDEDGHRNRQKRGCVEVKTGGSTYVRWGRSVCPSGAETIYNGIASGSKYNLDGGSDQTLCLPNDPEYFSGDTLKSHAGTLWGIRYEVYPRTASVPLNKRSGYEVPCAMCYVDRSAILTIPARHTCPTGWTLEYNGYLMSEYTTRNRPRKDTICADRIGESAETYAPYPSVNYLMNVHCDTGLTCPPYAADKPLTCAVCSK